MHLLPVDPTAPSSHVTHSYMELDSLKMPSLRELKYGVDLLVANLANVYFQQGHKSLKSLRKILASRVCTDVKTGKQKHTNIRRIKK